jgi:hypothetical protein
MRGEAMNEASLGSFKMLEPKKNLSNEFIVAGSTASCTLTHNYTSV